MKKTKGNFNFFSDFFENTNYTDDFGYNQIWNNEISKWLQCIYNLNQKAYEIGKKDVRQGTGSNRNKNRNSFLGEAMSIYYYQEILKATDFEIKPKDRIDFSCTKNNERLFVEVKSPNWQGEVFKDSNLTQKQKLERKEKPKYTPSEKGKSYSPLNIIIDPIKNSLHKFKESNNNIILITPNMLFTTSNTIILMT